MASILISRLIGFVRELVLAKSVGATGMTDVYYASFTIPDFLNHLMAAGALSISFIPILSGYIASGNEEMGKRVFRMLTSVMGALLFVFIVIAEIFAEPLAKAVAPGFSGEQLETLTFLTRIILPAQWFIFWGGLATAVQHTHGKFLIPALAPIFYNVFIIAFGVLMHRSHGVAGFSVGVLVGAAFSHGILQWIGIRKLGYETAPYFRLGPEMVGALKRYVWLTLPIMLGFSLVVTDEWISKYFASYLGERAISWLSYARTEMRIPIAVIGQAAGVASFPYLARLWSSGDFEKYGKTVLREISKLWAAAPVAAILLVGHALPITEAIYGGSRFQVADLTATAEALEYFGVGMIFWTLQMVLSRGFYACQRTWLPSLLGTFVGIATIPLYRYLGYSMGHKGLALAGTLAITLYTVILAGWLATHIRKHATGLSFSPFVKFVCWWSLVVVGLWFVSDGIRVLGVYQATRLTAIADVVLTTIVLAGISVLLLRTVFRRLTDGALF